MTPSDFISKALRMSEAATDGPWVLTVKDFAGNIVTVGSEKGTITDVSRWYWGEPLPDENLPNAEFIAFSREAVPKMAKALKYLMEERPFCRCIEDECECGLCKKIRKLDGFFADASEG